MIRKAQNGDSGIVQHPHLLMELLGSLAEGVPPGKSGQGNQQAENGEENSFHRTESRMGDAGVNFKAKQSFYETQNNHIHLENTGRLN